MDAQAWDARYGEGQLVWGMEPNTFVAAELGTTPPGRALDVACGEGRNAIWLAQRGWQVVGIDFSPVGLQQAAQLANRAGVADRIDFALIDVVTAPLPTGPFDAVIVAYLQLAEDPRRVALRKAAAAVAPGGTLLVVGHDITNLTEGIGGPQDPSVLFSPASLLDDLAGLDGIAVVRAERLHRVVAGADRDAIDALVRVQLEPH
ncbi:class I SAM-dependent methyltransferase [Mycolicibacter arupensis]|jgi:SAM-dependent methyltransferase|uniref:Class I SAM-dependent methyltransferase n=1 Tax=Mycolicibacter arupensis TaxID=342002 RepID=A0A5C7Y8Q5_9MYCO|nr:class I SAM-dependent methyltransferase [Mycolicibacter arupensis]TXI57967.1 MAG: class I SAM-dependent methyltransferase [Mycolicibacter arupensis]